MGFLDVIARIGDVIADDVQDFVEICNEPSGTSQPGNIPRIPPPRPARSQTQFFHGGPLQAVMDIFRNNRVKIGQSMPYGFYVASDFDNALVYAKSLRDPSAGKKGGVVEVIIHPSVTLRKIGDSVFYMPMPKATKGRFYRIPNIQPVRVFDVNKRQVA